MNGLRSALRLHLAGFLVALGVIGIGCGEKTTEPTDDGSTGAVTASVPPGGTQLVVRTAEGVTVTATFPAGAVIYPVDVTLTPKTPTDDNWFSVVFEPHGLIFREPVTVMVTVPESQILDDQVLYWGALADPILLPTVSGSGVRTVQTGIRSFGIPGEEFLFPTSPGPGGLAPRTSHQGGNQMNGHSFDCSQILAEAQTDFDRFLNQRSYVAAIRSALSSAETLQKSACPGAQDWLITAGDLACERFQAVLDSAAATSITGLGQFEKTAGRIIYWLGIVQGLQPTCPAVGTFAGVLDAEGQDFVGFYLPRLNALSNQDGQEWNTLKLEAAHIYNLTGEAYSVGAAAAANLILTKVLQPIYDRMRVIAYDLGRDHGWHYVLSRLTEAGFVSGRDIIGVPAPRACDDTYSPPRCAAPASYGAGYSDDDIYKDLQYCGTDLSIETVAVSDSVLGLEVAGGGASPGVIHDQVTLDCPTRGTLRFDGKLAAMTCWNDIEADNEVIVAFNGVDVLTLRRSPGATDYLNGVPAEIDIADGAAASGFVPTEGTQTEVTLRRLRTQCDDALWGPEEFQLLTATLVWKNPTLDVEITFPDQVEAGQPTPVDIRVGVVDQFGNPAYFSDVDVSLDIVGGSPARGSGQTDADGYFQTTITPSASAPVSSRGLLSAGPLAQQVVINATATSFEGVIDQASKTAVLIGPHARMVSANNRLQSMALAANGGSGCEAADPCHNEDPYLDESTDWSYFNSGNSTAACGAASAGGTMSASGSSDADLTTGIFTSIDADVSASGDVSADRSYAAWLVNPSTSANLSWRFEVLTGDLNYTLTGSAQSGTSGGSAISRSGQARIRLLELNSDGSFNRDIHNLRVVEDMQSLAESGTLAPGTYAVLASTSLSLSTGCNQEQKSASGTASFNLSLTAP